MNIKIGEIIEHGGKPFVVIDIKHIEAMDGLTLYVTAMDPAQADKQQQKNIKVEQVKDNMVDMIKKITEEGGPLSGFSIGE